MWFVYVIYVNLLTVITLGHTGSQCERLEYNEDRIRCKNNVIIKSCDDKITWRQHYNYYKIFRSLYGLLSITRCRDKLLISMWGVTWHISSAKYWPAAGDCCIPEISYFREHFKYKISTFHDLWTGSLSKLNGFWDISCMQIKLN